MRQTQDYRPISSSDCRGAFGIWRFLRVLTAIHWSRPGQAGSPSPAAGVLLLLFLLLRGAGSDGRRRAAFLFLVGKLGRPD
ncbi:hypothetical protein CDV36_011796 [Fusarium kuroshium]|uniref:Uncharacterized protein n=4 Tax=Fusarium solani species complex TaxID=232080 RepID=A0A3M2RTG8_9HYPO|nr:hypothetical protein CDV36_011796 [Fusarium kuroshium]RSL77664.1 hypothetical protein CEP51_008877 [Fusarium floridanum]RSL93635.1 hypothetical protein CDV31_014629 [Fusarium ambrosium]RSM02460.1 hypothetical protein CEP52_007948 [Fusarium oligoseptatum]